MTAGLVSKKSLGRDHHGMSIKLLKMPSCDRLSELLIYNPENGELTWRVSRSNMKSGDIAGYVSTGLTGRQDWRIRIDNKKYLSSRVIWMLYYHEDPGSLTIDHVDQNPLNNRITNLRLATAHEQAMNKRCMSPSTATRYIGVRIDSYKNGRRPRWRGQIRIAGHYYSFGSVAVDSINDEPPSWLVERAARLYALRDDPNTTDAALIDEINALKRVPLSV